MSNSQYVSSNISRITYCLEYVIFPLCFILFADVTSNVAPQMWQGVVGKSLISRLVIPLFLRWLTHPMLVSFSSHMDHGWLLAKVCKSHEILIQCGPPSDVSWFISPNNYSIVISTINHSEIGVINQLSYLGGLTLLHSHSFLGDTPTRGTQNG